MGRVPDLAGLLLVRLLLAGPALADLLLAGLALVGAAELAGRVLTMSWVLSGR